MMLFALLSLLFLQSITSESSSSASLTIDTKTNNIEEEVLAIKCLRSIDLDQINDGYCDCLYDEWLTSACSGSEFYPVLLQDTNNDGNDGYINSEEEVTGVVLGERRSVVVAGRRYMMCPIGGKIIPFSRINDGICDCCDGSDETQQQQQQCKDECKEIIEHERRQMEAEVAKIKKGIEIQRNNKIKFEALKVKNFGEIKSIEKDLVDIQRRKDSIEKDLGSLRQLQIQERNQRIQKIINHVVNGLGLRGLNIEELKEFIIGVTYLEGSTASLLAAGEEKYGEEDWKHSKVVQDYLKSLEEEQQVAATDDEEELDILVSSVEEEDFAYYDEDEYVLDEGQHDEFIDDPYSGDGEEAVIDEDEVNYEELNRRPSSVMSFSRLHFAKQATKLINLLNVFDNVIDNSHKLFQNMDPLVLSDLEQSLQTRLDEIDNSGNTAFLARNILQRIEEEFNSFGDDDDDDTWKEDILHLIALTLKHAKVGTVDVVDVLQYVVTFTEEVIGGSEVIDTKSCYHLPKSCPYEAIERELDNGVVLSIPHDIVIQKANEYCVSSLSHNNKNFVNIVCDDVEVENNIDVIDPLNIISAKENGYYGYYKFAPRSSDDLLESLFVPFYKVNETDTDVSIRGLEKSLQDIDDQETDKNIDLEKYWEELGGKDFKYGQQGELLALEELGCFRSRVGKYEYELCPFHKAIQKDIGENNRSEVDLGRWKGFEWVVNDTNSDGALKSQMRFEGGLKCWNGPSRSATAHFSCGSTNNIISAEEPETCVYHFEVESPVACTEEDAKRVGK